MTNNVTAQRFNAVRKNTSTPFRQLLLHDDKRRNDNARIACSDSYWIKQYGAISTKVAKYRPANVERPRCLMGGYGSIRLRWPHVNFLLIVMPFYQDYIFCSRDKPRKWLIINDRNRRLVSATNLSDRSTWRTRRLTRMRGTTRAGPRQSGGLWHDCAPEASLTPDWLPQSPSKCVQTLERQASGIDRATLAGPL